MMMIDDPDISQPFITVKRNMFWRSDKANRFLNTLDQTRIQQEATALLQKRSYLRIVAPTNPQASGTINI
jgi:hypothetical protein